MLKRSEYLKFQDPKELFNLHEKDTFRLWVWGFFVSLIVLNIFLGVNLIIFVVFKETIHSEIANTIRASNLNARNPLSGNDILNAVENTYNMNYLFFPIVLLLLSLSSLIVYVSSLVHSYKERDFKFISKWGNGLLSIGFLMGVIGLIYASSNLSLSLIFSGMHILGAISLLIMLMVMMIFGREVSFIRNSFIALYIRVEAKKQQDIFAKAFEGRPELSNLFNQNQFGPFPGAGYPPQNPNSQSPYGVPEDQSKTTEKTGPIFDPHNSRKNEAIKKLIDMSDEQLYKMAQTLNIYGYKEMPRSELVEKIYDITTPEDKR